MRRGQSHGQSARAGSDLVSCEQESPEKLKKRENIQN